VGGDASRKGIVIDEGGRSLVKNIVMALRAGQEHDWIGIVMERTRGGKLSEKSIAMAPRRGRNG
jgi:hypothetical protein